MNQEQVGGWAVVQQRSGPLTTRVFSAIFVISLLALLGWSAKPYEQASANRQPPAAKSALAGAPAVGQPAPDFTLAALHGPEQSLSQWRGQPVLLNFWASWCGPCRREMPELIAAHEEYQAEGLVVLAVNLSHQDATASVKAFVEEFQPPFPVLLDTTGEISDKLYRVSGLPMSFFIDRSGTIRHIYLGATNREWIDQVMTEMRVETPRP